MSADAQTRYSLSVCFHPHAFLTWDGVCAALEYKYESSCSKWPAVECASTINYFISSQPVLFYTVIRMELWLDLSLTILEAKNMILRLLISFVCVLRNGGALREGKYKEEKNLCHCTAGGLTELADEYKSCVLSCGNLLVLYWYNPSQHSHHFGKPGVKTGSFKNPATCIILATCLTTTDPVLKVKNRNIFAGEEQRICGGRMSHTSPKAFLSFNWLHQIMESRALMNGWRAVKHTTAE